MNEERLYAFEKMLSDILAQYDSVTEKLAALKAEERKRENRYLSPAFYKQTAISNDIVVLPDIRSFGE